MWMSINVQTNQAQLKDLKSFVWSVHVPWTEWYGDIHHKGLPQPPQSIARVIAVLNLGGIVVMADASINGRKVDKTGSERSAETGIFFSSTLLWLIYRSACPPQATGLVHKAQVQFIMFCCCRSLDWKLILQIFILFILSNLWHILLVLVIYYLPCYCGIWTELNHTINTLILYWLTLVNYLVL